MRAFLKIASCSCVSGCGHFLAQWDESDCCVSCLCFSLREHDYRDVAVQIPPRQMGGIPLAMPRSSSSISRKVTSAHGQGDLRITVRASPSSASPQASHSSNISQHQRLQPLASVARAPLFKVRGVRFTLTPRAYTSITHTCCWKQRVLIYNHSVSWCKALEVSHYLICMVLLLFAAVHVS